MPNTTLFIELFQPFAQYRNPFTFYYAQTYPLPPKSTVIGMLQNALGDWYGNRYGNIWDELKISIHGEFESSFWNYQNMIKCFPLFRKGRLMLNDSLLYGEGRKAQRSPVYQEELFNGRLFIFLKGNEELINDINSALENPKKVLSLGRSEDVIFIRRTAILDKAERITIKRDIKIPYSTYIIEKGFPINNKKYPIFYIPLSSQFINNGKRIAYKSDIRKDSTRREVKFESVIYTGRDYSIVLKDGTSINIDYYKIDMDGSDSTNSEYPIPIIERWGWL
ncbi:MAG: type I-B CRISPR-associated protein Cas5b [Candidatus Caldarchaeum sp.]